MKSLMAAALALLAGISAASAENAPADTSNKVDKTMAQPAAPKTSASVQKTHKTRIHHAMRMKHRRVSETTGAGNRVGTIGGPRNDPSIHQSIGGRDSRGYPKQQ